MRIVQMFFLLLMTSGVEFFEDVVDAVDFAGGASGRSVPHQIWRWRARDYNLPFPYLLEDKTLGMTSGHLVVVLAYWGLKSLKNGG